MIAFASIFFVLGIGFGLQRLRPLHERTLSQLSALVVEILIPIFLFATTATSASPEALSAAPALIVMGVIVPCVAYVLAVLVSKAYGMPQAQRSAFRFSVAIANTAFLGIPICAALFGPIGAMYAVLFDFGTTLVAFTLGVWVLSGGPATNLRPLILNPLILAVLAGLGWALTGWPLPPLAAVPLQTASSAALPMALLVGGAQLGNIKTRNAAWFGQLAGLTLTRLLAMPLLCLALLSLVGWRGLVAQVIVIEAAMPVGLTAAIMAKNYGADAEFASSAILWTTVAALLSLPLITFLIAGL